MIDKELLAAMPEHGDTWALHVPAVGTYAVAGTRKQTPRIPRVAGNVAVIPIQGVLTQKGSWFSDGTEVLCRTIQAAVGSKAIGGVVLDVCSPGGSVFGLQEFADGIYDLRGEKPIIAVANPLAASAAYWAAAAADQIVVTPSGKVGSVGIFSMHMNQAGMLEQMGLDVTLIYAGRYKTEGNDFQPLGDEAKAEMQRSVDEAYGMFISSLAKCRNTPKSQVEANYGQGRVMSAQQAVEAGMADRVATLDQVLEKMGVNHEVGPKTRAEKDAQDMLCQIWKEELSASQSDSNDPAEVFAEAYEERRKVERDEIRKNRRIEVNADEQK